MINPVNIDFSNISNNISGMDFVIKPNAKLLKAMAEIRAVLSGPQRKDKPIIKASGVELEIPRDLQNLLLAFAENIALNQEVHIAFLEEELTTQQAADYLDISRPTLIKMLNEHGITPKLVGKHRRITREQLNLLDRTLSEQKADVIREMIKEEQLLNRAEMRRSVKNAKA